MKFGAMDVACCKHERERGYEEGEGLIETVNLQAINPKDSECE